MNRNGINGRNKQYVVWGWGLMQHGGRPSIRCSPPPPVPMAPPHTAAKLSRREKKTALGYFGGLKWVEALVVKCPGSAEVLSAGRVSGGLKRKFWK